MCRRLSAHIVYTMWAPAFRAALQPLCDHRQVQGLRVVVVQTSDVLDPREIKAGDVVVLPAGTGHRLIEASRDFLVVGAYPEDGTYDECTDTRERPDAIKRIAKVRRPDKDPVYGKTGPMTQLWGVARRR